MLHGSGMDDVVDPLHRPDEAAIVANIADKIAHLGMLVQRKEIPLHLNVLLLIAAEDDETANVVPFEQHFRTFFSEGTSSSGNQNRTVVEHSLGQDSSLAKEEGTQCRSVEASDFSRGEAEWDYL